MKVSHYLLSCAIICGAGFWLGQRDSSSASFDNISSTPAIAELPQLPEPAILTGEAQVKLQSLPTDLWEQFESPNSLPAAAIESAQGIIAEAPKPKFRAPIPQVIQGSVDQTTEAKIAEELTNSISAITRLNGVSKLILADKLTTVRRIMNKGDIYKDGWKIKIIEYDRVILEKNGNVLISPIMYSANTRRTPMPYDWPSARNKDRIIQPASPPNTQRLRRRVTRQTIASN